MRLGNKCAVVYFAYRPEKEAVRKPIFPGFGFHQHVEYYRSMQSFVLCQSFYLGLPFVQIDERSQQGETFALRFCNAIEKAFSKGFEKLILLGNDAPEIDEKAIKNACRTINGGGSAIVSTQRGGACLIAITKEHYDRQKWLNLPWQSAGLADALAQELNDSVILQKITEIHSVLDVEKIIKDRKAPYDVLLYLVNTLQKSNDIICEYNVNLYEFSLHTRYLRGPPILF